MVRDFQHALQPLSGLHGGLQPLDIVWVAADVDEHACICTLRSRLLLVVQEAANERWHALTFLHT